MTHPGERFTAQAGTEPRPATLEAGGLTTRPKRRGHRLIETSRLRVLFPRGFLCSVVVHVWLRLYVSLYECLCGRRVHEMQCTGHHAALSRDPRQRAAGRRTEFSPLCRHGPVYIVELDAHTCALIYHVIGENIPSYSSSYLFWVVIYIEHNNIQIGTLCSLRVLSKCLFLFFFFLEH